MTELEKLAQRHEERASLDWLPERAHHHTDAAATPLIEARLRNALVEIAGLTHRQQLPITAQIHEVALAALGKGERP